MLSIFHLLYVITLLIHYITIKGTVCMHVCKKYLIAYVKMRKQLFGHEYILTRGNEHMPSYIQLGWKSIKLFYADEKSKGNIDMFYLKTEKPKHSKIDILLCKLNYCTQTICNAMECKPVILEQSIQKVPHTFLATACTIISKNQTQRCRA